VQCLSPWHLQPQQWVHFGPVVFALRSGDVQQCRRGCDLYAVQWRKLRRQRWRKLLDGVPAVPSWNVQLCCWRLQRRVVRAVPSGIVQPYCWAGDLRLVPHRNVQPNERLERVVLLAVCFAVGQSDCWPSIVLSCVRSGLLLHVDLQ
jgi:hypothetical protein